jgi:hypothetical protein
MKIEGKADEGSRGGGSLFQDVRKIKNSVSMSVSVSVSVGGVGVYRK